MQKPVEVCPICGTPGDCFEQCLDEMFAWYQRYYPDSMKEVVIFSDSQMEVKQ